MTRPTARVLALLELLQSGGLRTVAELADRLGVDERTVRRYVSHLVDLDLPVESVRGRYGGYRLARSHRLPPLMFTDDEALAVTLALRGGTGETAAATAFAKVRRGLPQRLLERLDSALTTVRRTDPEAAPTPEGTVLLPLADAVADRRPVSLRYGTTAGERVVHPRGIVAHGGRWYLTAGDQSHDGERRTFRLDRIERVRVLPGTFPAHDGDAVAELLSSLAGAPRRWDVLLRVRAGVTEIRACLPVSVAMVGEPDGDGWREVRIQAESLSWLPGVLTQLGRPFRVERPAELGDELLAAADLLRAATGRG